MMKYTVIHEVLNIRVVYDGASVRCTSWLVDASVVGRRTVVRPFQAPETHGPVASPCRADGEGLVVHFVFAYGAYPGRAFKAERCVLRSDLQVPGRGSHVKNTSGECCAFGAEELEAPGGASVESASTARHPDRPYGG